MHPLANPNERIIAILLRVFLSTHGLFSLYNMQTHTVTLQL